MVLNLLYIYTQLRDNNKLGSVGSLKTPLRLGSVGSLKTPLRLGSIHLFFHSNLANNSGARFQSVVV